MKYLIRHYAVASLLAVLAPLAGCASVQPAVRTHEVSPMSVDNAIRSATLAARDTNWIVKTTDKDTGHILAEREIRVLGRPERGGSYKLEVDVRNANSGNMTVKVTPTSEVMGGRSPDEMIAEFLRAFDKFISYKFLKRFFK